MILKNSHCARILLCGFFLIMGSPSHADERGDQGGSKEEEEFFTPKADRKKLKVQLPHIEGLPNVLLIGDSISIGYTPHVMLELKGKANVARIPQNGGDTARGLKNLDRWLGKKKWDLIHFNWGLHDLCYRHPESKVQGKRDKEKGTQQIALEQYSENLEKLVTRLKATNAQLIWANTSFVPAGEAGRVQGDDQKYNAAAERIMEKHSILINDLNSYSQTIQEHFRKAGDVHFTDEGSQKLGEKVAEEINQLIKSSAVPQS